MQFISNMLGGGSQAPATTAAAAGSNTLSLVGNAGDVLHSDGTKTSGGTPTTVGQALNGEAKILMLYFSMHNCPPCREFTPLLVELYNETNESSK